LFERFKIRLEDFNIKLSVDFKELSRARARR